MNDTTDAASNRTGKVARVLDEYGLSNLGDELAARWTAEDNRMSLRDLADYFNKQLLESQLDKQRVDILPGEVENIYKLLTDEDVTSGTRIQAENRLSEYGIDFEELNSDFVSRQAIHTYLTKHRQETYEKPDTDEIVERYLDKLQRLSSRQQAVTEQTLSTLRNKNNLNLGEFQVLSSVQVQCTDCGRQFDLTTLLDRGGCDCDTT
ncbi:rod-determining factor RdfA [Halohasta litorea]|uniref:Rod-determining factor RdfA n=1 Tax=Halohasta litorea TaxID=869891 RepID=A0ABD6DFI9_9EURY|nr:rod-determining factor RdfA [Halohasta litorea]